MNDEITCILDDIEKELGFYKREDQTDPFDEKIIERQINRVISPIPNPLINISQDYEQERRGWQEKRENTEWKSKN